jgi:nucleoside phosphorylase
MESAAAMMIANGYEIPCLAPKIISDTADSGFLAVYRNFSRNMECLATYLRRLFDVLTQLDLNSNPL